jgi:hypothetical protein
MNTISFSYLKEQTLEMANVYKHHLESFFIEAVVMLLLYAISLPFWAMGGEFTQLLAWALGTYFIYVGTMSFYLLYRLCNQIVTVNSTPIPSNGYDVSTLQLSIDALARLGASDVLHIDPKSNCVSKTRQSKNRSFLRMLKGGGS